MVNPLTDYYINSAYQVLGAHLDPERFQILYNYPDIEDPSLQIVYILSRGVRNIELEVWVIINKNNLGRPR